MLNTVAEVNDRSILANEQHVTESQRIYAMVQSFKSEYSKHLEDAKLKRAEKLRSIVQMWNMRFHERLGSRSAWERAECKRAVNIHCKNNMRLKSYLESLNESKVYQALCAKQRSIRVRESAMRILGSRTHQYCKRLTDRTNRERLNMIRARNMEIRLELRDRRLKQLQWEREISENSTVIPKNLSSVITKEQHRPCIAKCKEGNSSQSPSHSQTSKRATRASSEMMRYMEWRRAQAATQCRLEASRQRFAEVKEASTAQAIQLRIARFEQNLDLERRREVRWLELEKHRNMKVHKNRVSLVDRIIPELAL